MRYPAPYGKYVLLERLGIGGMSEVDLARQRMGDQDFVRFLVIKRVKTDHSSDASFIRMFKDEARITAELHHANIGQVYDFGREGDEYFLALEYVQGIDVREIVNTLRDRGQRVPVRVALRIIADVLDALDYAHNKRDTLGKPMQIVHRDVNPRNIMVSIHGETKLIDFGVAKATNRLEHTKTDHIKGKFSYMAPEQIKGEPIDGRADLFALGLTLHELLAGYGPFHGLNQVQIVHRLLHGKPLKMPDVPDMHDTELLRRLHDQSLARDRNERYPNAAAMRRDLVMAAEAAGGLPTRQQLAQFLSKVDPSMLDRLQSKIERYSRDVDGEVQPPPSPEPPGGLSGTFDQAAAPLESTQTVTMISTPAAVFLGVGAPLLFGVIGLVLVAILALLMFSGIWWTNQGVPSSPTPVVLHAAPDPPPDPPHPPAPLPSPPAPSLEPPAPTIKPTPPPRPAPTPVTPVRPEPVVEPAPVEPDPITEPVLPPEPTPALQPEPKKATGKVMVNAAEKGLIIRVDGVIVGKTPKAVQVEQGPHEIQVDGYPARTVQVRARQNTAVVFR